MELWCDCPGDLARQRILTRPRHPVHPDSHGLPPNWDTLVSTAEPLALTPVVRVDTSRPVDLPAREFALLAHLASRPKTAVSREDLLREVWGSSAAWQVPGTVTEHVRRVRQKIEREPSRPTRLVTVRGVGYRFDPEPS